MFKLENKGFKKVTTFLPQQISAKVLEKLKEFVETRLRDRRCKIGKCVVTVPAYFNEEQIRVTKEACLLADFDCLEVFHESTAAAISKIRESRLN